jgi:hypothetical protein
MQGVAAGLLEIGDHPLAGGRLPPVFPDTRQGKRNAVPHGDGIGCLAFGPLIAFHSKNPSTDTMRRRKR